MKDDKFLLISLEDEKAKHLSSVLSNKTCKKIIDLLAEKEMSERDIADKLNQPLNTVEYNLKKLIKSGMIEKSSNWFWSVKGKKIAMYKLSNKSIVISPGKTSLEKLKRLLPVTIIFSLATIVVGVLTQTPEIMRNASEKVMLASQDMAVESASGNIFAEPTTFPIWGWFLAGWLSLIIIYSIINWRKI